MGAGRRSPPVAGIAIAEVPSRPKGGSVFVILMVIAVGVGLGFVGVRRRRKATEKVA
jgi:LPXTG-motif cell wall-anchored protein